MEIGFKMIVRRRVANNNNIKCITMFTALERHYITFFIIECKKCSILSLYLLTMYS